MAMPKDFVYFVVSGLVIITIPIALIAWFQAGFFLRWMKVRASRGKLTLVKLRGKLRDHWEVGEIKGDFIVYGPKKERRRAVIGDGIVYSCFGVSVVDMNETTSAMSTIDYTAVTGHDAEKFEDLFTRALFRPTLEQEHDKLLLILLIIAIAAIIVVAFLTWNVSQQISALGPASITSVV